MTFEKYGIVCLVGVLAGCSGEGDKSIAADASTAADANILADASIADARVSIDGGEQVDAMASADAAISGFPTLSDYRRCYTDTDCPIGLGECIRQVPYNRADVNGDQSVAVSDIDSSFALGEGICSWSCSADPDICQFLSLNDGEGTPVPYNCQVVVAGTPIYNKTEPYPFFVGRYAMRNGQSFGAVCMPPLGLDPARIDSICQPCQDSGECGAGTCWDFEGELEAIAGGTCLEPCALDDACPFGFKCETLTLGDQSDASFCLPVEGTCGDCVDLDEDGRGTGHCDDHSFDCDDRNAAIYFDFDDPNHAFPASCGDVDFNCNGESDAVEVVGNDDYASTHCESCFDSCAGAVNGATLACTGSESNKSCVAQCTAPATDADCDGDPFTGCETSGGGGVTFYADIDGDSFGDLTSMRQSRIASR